MIRFSCICATYNRAPVRQYLLEEAIQSFLRQHHEAKELIVVNDCPQQKLEFNHHQVTIVNLDRRCRTLGEKYNLAVSLSTGDFIAPWDDDDISLPMRLTMAAKSLELSGSHYYKSAGQWTLNKHGMARLHNFVGHNNSAYSYKAFARVGGYPVTSWGADTDLDRKLRALAPNVLGEVSVTDWQYVYRWGVSDLHVSSLGDKPDPEQAWKAIGQKPVVAGTYKLEPKWLYDYSDLAVKAARSGLEVYQTPDLEFWAR